jgi:hypothetical protein
VFRFVPCLVTCAERELVFAGNLETGEGAEHKIEGSGFVHEKLVGCAQLCNNL